MKKLTKKQLNDQDLADKILVEEIKSDFLRRQEERRTFEAQWQLNLNFYMGNQYCDINGNFEVEDYSKKYFWQEREVFNHITPIVERRLSKLARVRPKINVFPSSNDEKDLKTASVSKKIIESIYNTSEMSKVISDVSRWSEICGSGFYKIIWNSSIGKTVAKYENGIPLKSGDVEIISVSPFEIFPESSSQPNLESSRSLIHARAYHIEEIKNRWGLEVDGEEINIFTLDKNKSTFGGATKITKTVRENYAIVIERYENPSVKYPNGRLVIVAGDKLLYVGEMPYKNGVDGERGYPFVKQDAFLQAGCFWGASVVERLIPLQRSYNAIKNRKHEFINRLSMGVLTVEDGSIDLDGLEEDGLCPGKILVYRQGSASPKYMDNENIPYNFIAEEQALLKEFSTISGITDISTENYITKGLSGTALELMIEQDESKMLITADSVRMAIRQIAKHILRLYKQFVKLPKLTKIVGDNGKLEIFYFNSSDISSDDIVFETKNEISDSFSQKRQLLFDLLDKGLLSDENGKVSSRMKIKVLELLGYGIWENASDIKQKHNAKASNENYQFMKNEEVKVLEIDDHDIHINEHISFMLSNEFENAKKSHADLEQKFLSHIAEHKKQRLLSENA